MEELGRRVRLRYLAAADFYKRKKTLIDLGLIVGALVMVGIVSRALDYTKKLEGQGTPTSKWEDRKERSLSNEMSPAEGAILKAENTISDHLKTVRPELLICCCLDSELEVIIFVELPLETGTEAPFQVVRTRLDNEPVIKERWVKSTYTDNEDTLFARSPALLVQKISKAKRMLVEIKLLRGPPSTTEIIEFDVQGFDQHLARIEAACARPGEKEK